MLHHTNLPQSNADKIVDQSGDEREQDLPALVAPRSRIQSLLAHLKTARTLDHLCQMIPELVARTTGCHAVVLYLVHEQSLYVVSSVPDKSEGFSSSIVQVVQFMPIPLSGTSSEALTMQQGHARVDQVDQSHVRVLVPLLGLGGPVGLLCLIPGTDEPEWGYGTGKVDHHRLNTLEDIAAILALILENTRINASNAQHAQQMLLLTNLTAAFNRNMFDLNGALDIVETQIRQLTGADRCSVVMSMGAMRPSSHWLHLEIVKMIQSRVQPAIINDVSKWRYNHLISGGILSFYGFPLKVHDRVIGVLALAFATYHTMDQSQQNLLEILANTASTLLHRARLYAEAEYARNQARAMLEQLQQEEQVKDAILRNVQSGLLTIDMEGRLTFINQQGAEVLGVDDAVAPGQRIETVMPLDEPGTHVVRLGLEPRPVPYQRDVRAQISGQTRTLSLTVAPLRRIDGKVIGAVCSFLDITRSLEMAQDINRLEAVSVMSTEASEIAHDMRNILQRTIFFLDVLLPKQPNESEREHISALYKQIGWLTSLSDNLMELNKPKIPRPVLCSAQELLDDVISIQEKSYRLTNIIVVRRYEPGATLFVDKMKILRACENIISNAIDAMPDGGSLTITTRTTRSGLPRVSSPETVPETDSERTNLFLLGHRQRAVEIEFSDTGRGIPPELIDQIWNPYRTFGKERGTGLGLAVVKKVVELHGGTCQVTSEPGKGTMFTLRLPASSK